MPNWLSAWRQAQRRPNAAPIAGRSPADCRPNAGLRAALIGRSLIILIGQSDKLRSLAMDLSNYLRVLGIILEADVTIIGARRGSSRGRHDRELDKAALNLSVLDLDDARRSLEPIFRLTDAEKRRNDENDDRQSRHFASSSPFVRRWSSHQSVFKPRSKFQPQKVHFLIKLLHNSTAFSTALFVTAARVVTALLGHDEIHFCLFLMFWFKSSCSS